MSDELKNGQRVRIKHGPDKGKTGTVFSVHENGIVHFVIVDGDELDVSYVRSWLEVVPDA